MAGHRPQGREETRDALVRAADAIAGAEDFARDELVAPHDGLAAAEVDDDVAVFDALDGAVDDLADAVLELVELAVALGFAHLLHDHLLGTLRADAPEVDRVDLLLDDVAGLDAGPFLERVGQLDLALRKLELFAVVLQHRPASERLITAGLAIDRHPDVGLIAVLLLGSRSQRGFERLVDDVLVDTLLVGDHIGHQQNVLVHDSPSAVRME